ncbi:MAG: MFS transporter [Rhodospirillaceae bacterium]|nr:MFS transporter [Rhodospirillaceae bacterium]
MTQVAETRRRRGILASGGFAHFIHDGFTDCLFVLLPLWATGFGLSHAQVGFLKMCMSGSLAASQVPAGFLAERFGERVVLATGTVLAGCGFLLLALADGFTSLAVILLITGTGCAVQHPLASSVISTAYGDGRRRAALGMYNFAGDLGKVVVPFSVAAIVGIYGWQTGTFIYGAVGVAAAVVIYFVLRRFGAGEQPVRNQHHDENQSVAGWGIRHRRGFAVLSGIGVIDSSARLAFMTFLPFLLMEKGLDVTGVGFALALIFSGGAAGKLICGLAAERIGILRTVIITELATGGLILTVIAADLTVAMATLPLLGIALNGTSSVLYGTVGDFVDPERQARAFGIFYTLGVGAGALAPLGYGAISDVWGVSTALTVLASTVFLTLPLCLALRPILRAA